MLNNLLQKLIIFVLITYPKSGKTFGEVLESVTGLGFIIVGESLESCFLHIANHSPLLKLYSIFNEYKYKKIKNIFDLI